MDNYLWLFICVDDYLSLFVIIDVFNVKECFFVIICNHLFVYFVKNIFIIISSMDKWASWLKTIKPKIQDFMISNF